MSEEIREELRADLLSQRPDWCATRWVLECSPFVFADYTPSDFWQWKDELARGLNVDSKDILIIGSGAAGVSLSRHKALKSFDNNSDIDVAVISAHHFDVAWRTLRSLGTRRYRLPVEQKNAVDEHVRRYIYWGTIATDRLLPLFPFADSWFSTLSAMRKHPATADRDIKARIYRDFASLRAYLLHSIKRIRDNLLSTNAVSTVQLN